MTSPLDEILEDIPGDMGIPDTLDALLHEVKRVRAEIATLRAAIDQAYEQGGPPIRETPIPKPAIAFPYFAQHR